AWSESSGPVAPVAAAPWPKVGDAEIAGAAEALKAGAQTCLFIGGKALRAEGLVLAKRIEAATGAKVICEVFPARIQRGRGRPAIERLPYLGEFAADVLKDFSKMVVVGTKAPVSFFAYPGKPSVLTPEGCQIQQLADARDDQLDALQRLVEALGAPELVPEADPALPPIPGVDQPFTAEAVGAVVASYIPDNAIVSDEANTSGIFSYGLYEGAAPHDWMTLTGGAIGQGMPLAVGAALACPERKVINLQADGAGMYTNQALWTMARENLDVVVVLYNNASYAILNLELMRVGVENPGERAKSMLDLSNPTLDWVKLAEAQGVNATRATNVEEFEAQFKDAMGTKGPRLIEVVL
ncbi:MAG: acetolactate synthase large subunit, partial [Cellvibrionaceae bacterium]|nr:acetolactate synthase large subunit [Cellvibrionaceae bacterium]